MPLELPPQGTKVRLVVEGFLDFDGLGRQLLRRDRDGGRGAISVRDLDDWAQFEVLEEAKPVWWPPQDGDTILIPGPQLLPGVACNVYTRCCEKWLSQGSGEGWYLRDEAVARGYLLARDGEPYGQYGQHTA